MKLAKPATTCSLRSVKFVSSIVFALMVAVLPTAGAAHYFCSSNMECAGDASDCLSGDDSCCGETGENAPDCLIAKNVLPEAEHPYSGKFLNIQVDFPVVIRLIGDEIPVVQVREVNHETQHVPGSLRRLYIDQRRLLI